MNRFNFTNANTANNFFRQVTLPSPKLPSAFKPFRRSHLHTDMSTQTEPRPVKGKPFRIALIQLGSITPDKSSNLSHARTSLLKAFKSTQPSPDILILPECFNSLYGVEHFEKYAEVIGFNQESKEWKLAECKSESVKMLSEVAKETQTWLFGGELFLLST